MPADTMLEDTPAFTGATPATPAAAALKSQLAPLRLVLTGFMGAGKSTVGRLLAQQISWQFIDVDREVELRAGMSVADIFKTLGEFVFRRMETSAIAHALGERHAILALGGGAAEVLANRLLLEQTPRTAVILLHAPLATLLERCDAQATDPATALRPILQNRSALEERFLYRAPLYRRIARHTIDTTDRTPQQTVTEIRSIGSF